MIKIYNFLMIILSPLIRIYLHLRALQNKEIKSRLNEKYGTASLARPQGNVIWVHAASVGEAQAALIIIKKINEQSQNISFLVTTVTLSSANMLEEKLPHNAIHQFVPIDHPDWINKFINHWKPDLALFLESEIWPNILITLKKNNIPSILINGRLSDNSYKNWCRIKTVAQHIFSTFNLILTQSPQDTNRFKEFGANAHTVGNIKLNASPLAYDKAQFNVIKDAIGTRPFWVYASTHDGEEELAARVHLSLKEKFSDLLTIIVPRHPTRREDIQNKLKIMGLKIAARGDDKKLFSARDDIYLVDTMGELGLFYRLTTISMIGRCFSHDGGGGHNPIEAAQLNSIVLTGPNIQYQHNLFTPMFEKNAAIQVHTEEELVKTLSLLFSNKDKREEYLSNTKDFMNSLENIIDTILAEIKPFLPN